MNEDVTKILIPLPIDFLTFLKKDNIEIELDTCTYYPLADKEDRKSAIKILTAQVHISFFIKTIPDIDRFLEDIIFIAVSKDCCNFRIFYRKDMKLLIDKIDITKEIFAINLRTHPLRTKEVACTNCKELTEVPFYCKNTDTDTEEFFPSGETLCEKCENLRCWDCGEIECNCEYCEQCGEREEYCTCDDFSSFDEND